MYALYRHVLQFLRGEEGPTAVEYAVMLALIIVVVFAAVQTLGSKTNASFSDPTLGSAIGTSSGS